MTTTTKRSLAHRTGAFAIAGLTFATAFLISLENLPGKAARLGVGTVAHAGCWCGCLDRLHICPGFDFTGKCPCDLNEPEIRSCAELVTAVAPRVNHHIHHHCKAKQYWNKPKEVLECGVSQMMGDNYGEAIERRLLKKVCKGDRARFMNLLYNHPAVVAKVKEHVAYWRPGNPWAALETAKDNVVAGIEKG
jgi:hypothetical protein